MHYLSALFLFILATSVFSKHDPDDIRNQNPPQAKRPHPIFHIVIPERSENDLVPLGAPRGDAPPIAFPPLVVPENAGDLHGE